MKKYLFLACCLGFAAPLFIGQIFIGPLFAQDGGPAAPAAASAEEASVLSANDEMKLQIIRYGTDSEISTLIKVLRSEQPSSPAKTVAAENPIEKELFLVAEKSKNRTILTGIFGYFTDREVGGLETRALAAIKDRDYEAAETVNAAIQYLGKLKTAGTRDILMDIMNGEESRFLSGAIRALGMVAEKDRPSETAEYLIAYYKNRDPGDENRRLLIVALGDTKAAEGTAFLVSIADNEDERVPLRIAAMEALSKIGDPAGLSAVTGAVSSKDPNVRSSAVGSLAPFSGAEVDAAIIEAFRDSYYRTRIAAAKAAGERKLVAAVPFLKFRCENDEVPAVRDEAVKALGLIAGKDSEQILAALFKERKNSDRIRISAAETLLSGGFGDHVSDVIIEMDEAKTKNQTALYNGLLRVLGGAVSPKLEDLARRFFANGGVVEKSFALDMCSKNNFRSLENEVRKLTDPKNGSLTRKALAVLEGWGLPAEASSSAASTAPAAPVPVSN
jgi:HEAT repeat protein